MTLTKSSVSGASRLGERIWEIFTDSRRVEHVVDLKEAAEQAEDVLENDAEQPSPAAGVGFWFRQETSDDARHSDAESGNERDFPQCVETDEVQLIDDAKQNPDLFGILYERYVDRIYAYIFNRVGNAQDSEDLTARTFYMALSRLDGYEDRGFPFSAWLFRIAHNLVANWHRDNSKRHFLSLDRIWTYSRDEELPETKVEQAEKHSELWEAINRLPEERRSLLLYKFSSRMSNVEIGELMDKSESAIKSLYFRTLAALRTDLESNHWE